MTPDGTWLQMLSGLMRTAGRMSFAAEESGTRVDFEMALNPRGMMKLISPVVERQVQETNRGHLARSRNLPSTADSDASRARH
jgi:hypothetical protein